MVDLQKTGWPIFLPDKKDLNIYFSTASLQVLLSDSLQKQDIAFQTEPTSKWDCILLDETAGSTTLSQDVIGNLNPDGMIISIENSTNTKDKDIRQKFSKIGAEYVSSLNVEGEALVDTGMEWVIQIPRTGKLDFLRSELKKLGLKQNAGTQSLAIWSLDSTRIWINRLIDSLINQGLLRGPVAIGRVDKMRTGNTIIQIKDASECRFALKVLDSKSQQADDSSKFESLCRLLERQNVPAEIKGVIPRMIQASDYKGVPYQLETWTEGRPASAYFYYPKRREAIIDKAVDWSILLQDDTRIESENCRLDLSFVQKVLSFYCEQKEQKETLSQTLHDFVETQLSRFPCKPNFFHGDYWVANILVDESNKIRGVVDWEYSQEQSFPMLDIFHLLFHRKTLFGKFSPWGELELALGGKIEARNHQRIFNSLDRLGIDRSLLFCLLVVYWLIYLDTRYEIMIGNSGWYESAFLHIYTMLANQSDHDWYRISQKLSQS
ncbi:MAG: phosphotransferase [Gammaproteobacteria bacterium]|nr:phosphotransferase [Gammaproteobacteria bacterium]MDH5692024.1 phosphotransferase [Gammaproteobacteria bacterium]